jgi:hypothetical protein
MPINSTASPLHFPLHSLADRAARPTKFITGARSTAAETSSIYYTVGEPVLLFLLLNFFPLSDAHYDTLPLPNLAEK